MDRKKRKSIIISAVGLVIIIAILVIILILNAQLKDLEKEQALNDSIKKEWYNALKGLADGETKFRLSEVTPFEWDEVYIASGYYEKETLKQLLGDKSDAYFGSSYEKYMPSLGTDLSTTWIFFLDGELVFSLGTFDIFSPGERIGMRGEEDTWVTARILEGSEIVYVYVCE